MEMRAGRWLLAIWICFLIRAGFYCAAVPLWDGFDEWSHFGVVQRMAFRGEALVSREAPLPRNTAATFGLAPLPWSFATTRRRPPATTPSGFCPPKNGRAASKPSAPSRRNGRAKTPPFSKPTKACRGRFTAG